MATSLSIITKVNLALLFVLGLAAALIAYKILEHEEEYLEEVLVSQAERLFRQGQAIHHWGANHGGVYVYKREGMKPNPYLYKTAPAPNKPTAIAPEISDSRGRKLILIDPIKIEKEIESETSRYENVIFHLTSLNPINPDNRPDRFEERALRSFKKGDHEVHRAFLNGGNPYFRYIAPVRAEANCLNCHGVQGHKRGDILGGISVEFPMRDAVEHSEGHRIEFFVYATALFLLVSLTLTLTVRRLVSNPVEKIIRYTNALEQENDDLILENAANDEIGSLERSLARTKQRIQRQQHALQEKASELDLARRTDPLTGANNRQHFLLEMPRIIARANRENSPTSILMVDIDHFKEINDHYGHAKGDQVLQQMVEHMLQQTRSYDMLVRYGGEEFLVVMPNTENHDATMIAERIRKIMESCQCLSAGDKPISYTVSIGVYTTMQEEIDQMLLKVDDAMYKAKEAGRNRVYNAV